MDTERVEAIMKEYDQYGSIYRGLTSRAHHLIEELIRSRGINVHMISSRHKSRESLSKKISKQAPKYIALSDITDIAGVRITTFFAADVDAIAQIVEEEFAVDRRNSVDKREASDPTQFGYRSLHYVVSLGEVRANLAENKQFAEKKFEIQIRSILQHAWAEIEHDLGYKSDFGVPRQVRRRFSRVSGLLELADDEFEEIRKELSIYAKSVNERIATDARKVYIDKISLAALLDSKASALHQLAVELAGARQYNATLMPADDHGLEVNTRQCAAVGIVTIADLENIARSHGALCKAFSQGSGHLYFSVNTAVSSLIIVYVWDSFDAAGRLAFVEKTAPHAVGGAIQVLDDKFERAKKAIASGQP